MFTKTSGTSFVGNFAEEFKGEKKNKRKKNRHTDLETHGDSTAGPRLCLLGTVGSPD